MQEKLPRCADAVAELVDEGRIVYVHCNVGMYRSPSMAIAYLHWKRDWDLNQAESFVRERRSVSPRMEVIRRAGEDMNR